MTVSPARERVGTALERIAAIDEVFEIVTTDTVAIDPARGGRKLRVLSAAPIFADAIRRNYCRQSIGDLVACGESELD